MNKKNVLAFVMVFAWAASCALAQMALDTVNPDFRIDDEGNVYHVRNSRRIYKNGRSTSWYIHNLHKRWLVSPTGNLYHTDSYGRLSKNGSSLHYDWIREGYFKIDKEENVYTVGTWVSEKVQKNGHNLSYEIQEGGGFVVDPDGRVFFRDKETRTLHIDRHDTEHNFWSSNFVVGEEPFLYYVVRNSSNVNRLLKFNWETGKTDFVTILAHFRAFRTDKYGALWYADSRRRIFHNGVDTGYQGYHFRIDDGGTCWSVAGTKIFKNGDATGWYSHGAFEVTPAGDVYHLGRKGSKKVYRNGEALSFTVSR